MRDTWRPSIKLLGNSLPTALVALLAMLFLVPPPGYSQVELAFLGITKVNTEGFPLVQLQVAAVDSKGIPIDLLPSSSLRVTEDGAEIPIQSVEPHEVGVRVAFLVDPGDGVRRNGIKFATVYATAAEQIRWFMTGRPWMLPGVDEVAVIAQEGYTTRVLTHMTSDPAAVEEQLSGYTPPSDSGFLRAPQSGDYTRVGLARALDEIEFSPTSQDKLGAVVVFSGGSRADYAAEAERAINLGIPIHVVLVRTQATVPWAEYWSQALRPLAQVTGGEFRATHEASGLEPLLEAVAARRTQYVVTYRSSSPAAGSRQVVLELNTGDQTLSTISQYSVALQPPQVEIVSPTQGSIITRAGQKGDESEADAPPTFVTVVAQVTWPDGFPRQVRAARLVADDVGTGQARIAEDRVEITWDIRSYQTEGRTPVVLQAQAEDELGLPAISPPVTVSIEFTPYSGLPENVLIYVAIGAALLALAAAIYVLINRGKLAPMLQQAGEGLVDFVERVTGRRSALVARAYLVPVEGFEEPPAKAYEIYGTTAIGRSRRHADLLFHINEEDSAISRLHCTILDEDDHFSIRDEDSSNGTFLNGERLTPLVAVMLSDGDTIDLAALERGGLRFIFQLASVDGSQPTSDDDLRRTQPRRGAVTGRGMDEPGGA